MCWYCEKWKRSSPQTFARWTAFAQESPDPREAGLLIAAREFGVQIVATTRPKVLRRMVASGATTVSVENLKATDGSRVTSEDRALFNWAVGHVIAEWGDVREGSDLHH